MVLDSSGMLAMMKEETGANEVRALFEDADVEIHAHSANLCEVFHQTWRAEGEAAAFEIMQVLKDAGVIERSDMDGEFWRDAGSLIVTRRLAGGSLPLGDALGVALARRLDVEFVTSDKHEFAPLHDANLVKAFFIR